MTTNSTSICCEKCKLPIFLDESLLELSLVQKASLTNTHFDTTTNNRNTNNIDSRLHKLKNVTNLQQLNNSILNSLDSYVFLDEDIKEKNDQITNTSSSNKHNTHLYIESESQYESSDSSFISVQDGHNRDLHTGIDSDEENNKTLSRNLKALSNIFNILSSKSKVDHPLCSECCDLLLNELNKQYEIGIKERNTYQDFLTKLKKQQNSIPTTTENTPNSSAKNSAMSSPIKKRIQNTLLEKLDSNLEKEQLNELNGLNAESTGLIKNLEILEDESKKLDLEIEKLKLQEREIENKNQELMGTVNEMDLNTFSFLKDWGKLSIDYEHLLVQYDDLRKINVYNELFLISHRGLFGTINNCRIGGYEGNPVSWKEINAGLGQVILLLSCIIHRLKIKLPSIAFEPMGSYSRICVLQKHANSDGAMESDWKKYNCFYDRTTLTDEIKYFFKKENDFDMALETILRAIDAIQKKIPNSEFPYVIEGDKINGISIKLGGGQPTLQWSMANKFMLTNLKWLLAFTSKGV